MSLDLLLLLLIVCISSLDGNNRLTFAGSDLELKLADLEKSYILSEVSKNRDQRGKCRLTQLEEEMARHKSNVYPDLLRLRDLRRKYTGDKFTRLQGSWCEDKFTFCESLARQGTCGGTNIQFEKFFSRQTNETTLIRDTGFTKRKLEDVHPSQIAEMSRKCRTSCKNYYEDTKFEDLPEMVKAIGGYYDVITDNVGHQKRICSFEEGWLPDAADRAVGIHLIGAMQPPHIPQFHPVGFEKMKIPKDLYARILNNRKKQLNAGNKWEIERCDFGMQNCQKVLESQNAQECHVVSAENYWLLKLDSAVKEEVFDRLRVGAEDWTGRRIELAGTSIYGIRRYSRGAWLLGHLDHLRTHVISAILNIKQKVDSDWPLQIYDHAGTLHEVVLEEGEMVWYESAKMVHGRSSPLNGSYFENIFVHYMPRSRFWFKKDFNVNYGDPVTPITLESLQQADLEMRAVKEELRKEVSKEKERMGQFGEQISV